MLPEIAKSIGILLEIARPLGLSPILIGALASEAAPDRPNGAPSARGTLDADFALQVPDWEKFQAIMEGIVAAGHRRDPHIEHRAYIQEIMIDIVPFGRGVAPDGLRLIWPQSGLLMDLTGMEEAAGAADDVDLTSEVRIRCITIPSLILLKTSAYLDRQQRGEPKHKSDAEDILFWLRYYASGDDDGPRYDILAANAPETIDHFAAGAAALGRDVAKLASPKARERLDQLIAHARLQDSPFWTVLYQSSFTEDEVTKALSDAKSLLEAFSWGVASIKPR